MAEETKNCCCSQRRKVRERTEEEALLQRLSRIEGQVRGVRGMVENSAYCTDILTQVSAIQSALNAFNRELLARHIRTCVVTDIEKGDLTVVDDLVIEQVLRTGTAAIGEKYLSVIRKAAGDYTKEIFHKLREREYNPELMRLYVVGGGGCMIQNFGEYDKNRVTIVRDICATAKGYEAMTVRKIQRNGGMLV